MELFTNAINSVGAFKELSNAIKSNIFPCSVTGVSNIHKAQFTLGISLQKSPILLLCDDEASARRMTDDINTMSGSEAAVFYPAKDFTFADVESVSKEYEHTRISALYKIISRKANILVAGAEASAQLTIPCDILISKTITIKTEDTISTDNLSAELIKAGYSRCSQVEGQSQFAIRGSIIDIFPVGENLPIRIELWGDEIDTMCWFDIESQRRTEQVSCISIPPAHEILFDSNDDIANKIDAFAQTVKNKKDKRILEYLEHDAELCRNGTMICNTDKYISLAYEKPASLFDYFKDGIVVVSEFFNIQEKLRGFNGQLNEDIKLMFSDGILCKGLDIFSISTAQMTSLILNMPSIFLDTFMRGNTDIRFKKLINSNALQTSTWSGELKQLIEEITSYTANKYSIILFAGSEKTIDIIVSDLRENNINARAYDGTDPEPSSVVVLPGSVSSGYDYPSAKLALITQSRAISAIRKPKKRKKGEEIKSISDINEGDLVVHSLYGIGRFAGITKIDTQGITKDYITIKYAGTDVLYVPVTQLDLVSRYVGPRDDTGVKLNKLNSQEWQKTRTKVRKAVKDMADELIKLYAKRQASKGFAFSKDNDFQADFDERFPYAETDDQLRCIDEIKQDMQKNVPMDRLLCGDVGFGKTEVALRGAMKCVLDSKQCAILVPTTVLAWQHYQTAIKRFEHFPVTIQLLSRFRTPKQQQEILKDLKNGQIDIIIGTHRLVQKDVMFKDLGLVIIDEEQRFGVAHKEKFKENFAGVDVLTLSATPIPRTLNMAMSGIRDMSVIEDPPQDRHPVQTYVIEHNFPVIIQAITKELRRGGQVYYIHNRIDSIVACATQLQNALPEARIGIAHGQISENELSEVWRKLIDHEIDILVCTTLIETGVDVPNCNTLIIEDADRLGLSQLYQLRGRVGRSNRRAFAYFTFRRGKVLTEIATKRLNAIREFTQFGSGFRIAMRDLEIRGAGSILNGKQHGHMEAVGYDMYIRLLNEAIAEEKGEPLPKSPEDCLVDIAIDAFIPEKYIEDLAQRIDAYRRIASIQNKEDSLDVLDELIDRYGDPPKSVMGLIDVALMRNIASSLGITEISQRSDNLLFFIKEPSMEQIKALSTAFKGRVLFNSTKKPYISIKLQQKQKTSELMQKVLEIMQSVNS